MRKLFGHCNELLQLSMVAYHVMGKVKAVPMFVQREVAKNLLESLLHHKMKLPEG